MFAHHYSTDYSVSHKRKDRSYDTTFLFLLQKMKYIYEQTNKKNMPELWMQGGIFTYIYYFLTYLSSIHAPAFYVNTTGPYFSTVIQK